MKSHDLPKGKCSFLVLLLYSFKMKIEEGCTHLWLRCYEML